MINLIKLSEIRNFLNLSFFNSLFWLIFLRIRIKEAKILRIRILRTAFFNSSDLSFESTIFLCYWLIFCPSDPDGKQTIWIKRYKFLNMFYLWCSLVLNTVDFLPDCVVHQNSTLLCTLTICLAYVTPLVSLRNVHPILSSLLGIK